MKAFDEFLDQVTVLPPGEWDPNIRLAPPPKIPAKVCFFLIVCSLIVIFHFSLNLTGREIGANRDNQTNQPWLVQSEKARRGGARRKPCRQSSALVHGSILRRSHRRSKTQSALVFERFPRWLKLSMLVVNLVHVLCLLVAHYYVRRSSRQCN